ncbi:piggyBac transposable element-derived protein 3-like [Ischnura elegans]|uniref:piggyBac transposable element-derived protein 3-like n=1 Tax=Ischnura elegans TaxID=197161 RepID=UPI001ED878CF|nr:piggyBac transposable element-derived protein 3-like [Ischnura elegans]
MNPDFFYGKKRRKVVQNVIVPPEDSDDPHAGESSSDEDVESESPDDSESASDSFSEDETTPELHPVESVGRKGIKRLPVWKATCGADSPKTCPLWLGQIDPAESVKPPVDYFLEIFDREIITHIVEQSNLYALQVNVNKPLNVSPEEIEQFLGCVMYMSIFNFPRSRMYWGVRTKLNEVSSVISRNRFEDIKSKLHFNDNTNMVGKDNPLHDKLFKIRPIYDHVVKKFQAIPQSGVLCVDEQIVPFKGKSTLKQYNPKKPYKWGYKIFVLCDTKGLVHNFELYTGKITPLPGVTDIGASGNVVLNLVSILESNKNFTLYFDNWFTSLALLTELHKKGVYSLGTVRCNRIPGCNLLPDKELKKRGRGSIDEKEATVDGVSVRVVKWFDNRPVTLMGTFGGAHPMGTVQRWDKKGKGKVEVQCPRMVKMYNDCMGGVDLCDANLSRYRIFLKSRKYYHRLFFHFVDLAVVNSWSLYRRDCDSLGISKKKQNDLLEFKMRIAEALTKRGKDILLKKRGRKSHDSVDAKFEAKRKRGPANPIPETTCRVDGVGHWPQVKDVRQRCKNPGCSGKTVFLCTKCDVHLCLNKNSNCFIKFHEK